MELKRNFLILAGLACAASALAQPGNESTSQRLDLPPPAPMTHIEPRSENGITYLCGGVGEEEAEAMKQTASDYDLMITFAAVSGEYLADVNVELADSRGTSLLTVRCDAPIMLVDFDRAGDYRIRATANGYTVSRRVQVRPGGKVRNVAMAWPVHTVDMGAVPTLRGEQSSGGSGATGVSEDIGTGAR